jgi:hypothetical protein
MTPTHKPEDGDRAPISNRGADNAPEQPRGYALTLYEENWTATRRNCIVDRGDSGFQTDVFPSRDDLIVAFAAALRDEWDERIVHINGYTYESLGKVKTALPEPEPEEFWRIEEDARLLVAEQRDDERRARQESQPHPHGG